MKKICLISFIILIINYATLLTANETWSLDKKLSSIKFELPVLFANNVKGEFKEIEGLVKIDTDTKENNKAIFVVEIDTIDMNYKKYKNLLLSNIFFDSQKYPKALVDTKKFTYKDENILQLNADFTIKGVTRSVPLELEIIQLAEELVQIKGKVKFSRTAFGIGIGKWTNTSVLKDNAIIDVNLFLFKE